MSLKKIYSLILLTLFSIASFAQEVDEYSNKYIKTAKKQIKEQVQLKDKEQVETKLFDKGKSEYTQEMIKKIQEELGEEGAEVNSDTLEKVYETPELYLRDQTVVKDFNYKTGIYDRSYYTGDDNQKLAASLLGHLDTDSYGDLLGFQLQYAHKIRGWWYEAFYNYNKTTFGTVSDNKDQNPDSLNEESESKFERLPSTDETVSVIGLGTGMRYRLDFLIDGLFHTVMAYGTYITMSDTFRDRDYTGFGLRADYGVHHRASSSLFYGVRMSYNLGWVAREQVNDEVTSERRLGLQWLAMAFDIGYYF